ncbi:MAG: hypothetical protein H6739_39875 [Alphaproteobacteria bacterium]|nr:hypothetical protein [Alphaproteobacteria bacterium]
MPLLLLLACSTPPEDTGPPPATEGQLTALTYNVHGLPPGVTGDDTPGRMTQIAPRLPAYPLIGLQEDFDPENHALLVAQAEHQTQAWFDEVLDDRVYPSGLAVLVDQPLVELLEVHYDACNGLLDGASDCFASKGFQVLRLQLGAGQVDVYNTHMEAGSGEADDAARATQVDQLVATLNGFSADRAVIFLGDSNLHDDDPDDLPLVEQLKEEGGLTDACDAVGCPEPGRIDRVMIRSAGGVHLEVLAWRVDEAFVDAQGVGLSDHDAVSATLAWSVE